MKKLLPAVLVAGTAFAAIAAAPTGATATVAVDGTTVTVSGALTEDLSVTGATNDAGDVPAPMTGHDITSLSISYPEAGVVAFHMAIDANPGTGFAPALAQYALNPTIGETTHELVANATVTSPGALEFASNTCAPDPQTGTNTCTPSPIEGSYEAGVITWFVPTNAAPGTLVSSGTGEVNPYFEVVWLVNGLIDSASGASSSIPAAKLVVDGEVLATGTLSNDEGFSVSADLAPGTYEGATLQLCQTDFGPSFNECLTVELDTIVVEDAAA